MEYPGGINPEWLKTATDLKCEKCESVYFKPVLRLRKISKLMSGQLDDIVVPIKVMACAKCNHVNKDLDIDDNKIDLVK